MPLLTWLKYLIFPRSLYVLYGICTQHHQYWTGSQSDSIFMCTAVRHAYLNGEITHLEKKRVLKDIKELLHSIDPTAASLIGALNLPILRQEHKSAKEYWETYFKALNGGDHEKS